MSRKYYCELCDKRFADNAQNRKNHIKGLHHQRMKKLHYDAFRDAGTILAEENLKKPCRTFLQTGECRFTPNCRFSHLTPEERQDLERRALENKQAVKAKYKDYAPSLTQWLKKRNKKSPDEVVETVEEKPLEPPTSARPTYALPEVLVGIPNLPISLLPPPPGSLDNLPVQEWG